MNAKKMLFAGVCLLAACFTQAQESQMPKAFSYQAVVRDNAGKVVANKEVGVKIEILKGSAEGDRLLLQPTALLTRAQAAAMLMRYCNIMEEAK